MLDDGQISQWAPKTLPFWAGLLYSMILTAPALSMWTWVVPLPSRSACSRIRLRKFQREWNLPPIYKALALSKNMNDLDNLEYRAIPT
jgi:hypothetical protein